VGRSRSFPNSLDTSYSFVPGSSRNAWIISYFRCGFWQVFVFQIFGYLLARIGCFS
jgi:hypothetical protein